MYIFLSRIFFLAICTLLPDMLRGGPACLDLADDECQYNSTEKSLTCSGNVELPDRRLDTRILTFCNYPYNDFDVTDILSQYPRLETFALMSSNVTYVRGKFPPNNSLQVCIHHTWTNKWASGRIFRWDFHEITLLFVAIFTIWKRELSLTNSLAKLGENFKRKRIFGNTFLCYMEEDSE